MGMKSRTAHAWAKNKQKDGKEGKKKEMEGRGRRWKPYVW
jgi:hypothetical protein